MENFGFLKHPQTNFQDSSRDMSMRGDVQQCNQMVDYNIRYDLGEIRILCNQPEAQITRYRYPSMTFIVDAPSNPKAMLGGMNSMNNLFHNAALQLDIVTSTYALPHFPLMLLSHAFNSKTQPNAHHGTQLH
jgi:hypothetical protein